MSTSTSEERTYGNWRRPTSPGVAGLGLLGTMILMGGMVFVALAMLLSLWAGVVAALLVAAMLAPMLLRDRHGRNALQGATARLSWWRGRSKGWHLYRSGPTGVSSHGSCALPGLLASSRLLEAEDSFGRPFALIHLPRHQHYTVVLECGADGAALVDREQLDTWVAYWGQWLAALSFEPGLVGASVTIETAPDLGQRLRSEVVSNSSARSPQLSRRVLREVLESYPSGSAQVSTRIALTYGALPRPGGRRRNQAEMAREIGTRLPGLSQNLAMTGAGSARPMAAHDLATAVRIAYDPDCQRVMEYAGTETVGWQEAGPVAAQESWDHYRHDSAYSITWGMSEAPRGEVLSSVLNGLVAPHHDILRKRVTLLYRPHDPGTAARIVERDRKDARFKISGPEAAARDSIAVQAADQSAQEEAKGAGLARFTMLVTATVRSLEELSAASAAIDTLAPPARIRLRRMYGSQAAAFAAALPLGIVLPSHLQVPTFVRESM